MKPLFNGLDHIAIAVPDTEEALNVWRDLFGFSVLHQETVNDGAILLTHLDLGKAHLQLVEPLLPEHPLQDWLRENGPGLHHFCLQVDDVDEAKEACRKAGIPCTADPHQGVKGMRALFLDKAGSDGIQVELTGR